LLVTEFGKLNKWNLRRRKLQENGKMIKNVFYEKIMKVNDIIKWFKRKSLMYKDYYNFVIEHFNEENEIHEIEEIEYWRMILKEIKLIYNFTQQKLFYNIKFEKLNWDQEDKIWRQKD
jgi:hypothetical protein